MATDIEKLFICHRPTSSDSREIWEMKRKPYTRNYADSRIPEITDRPCKNQRVTKIWTFLTQTLSFIFLLGALLSENLTNFRFTKHAVCWDATLCS